MLVSIAYCPSGLSRRAFILLLWRSRAGWRMPGRWPVIRMDGLAAGDQKTGWAVAGRSGLAAKSQPPFSFLLLP